MKNNGKETVSLSRLEQVAQCIRDPDDSGAVRRLSQETSLKRREQNRLAQARQRHRVYVRIQELEAELEAMRGLLYSQAREIDRLKSHHCSQSALPSCKDFESSPIGAEGLVHQVEKVPDMLPSPKCRCIASQELQRNKYLVVHSGTSSCSSAFAQGSKSTRCPNEQIAICDNENDYRRLRLSGSHNLSKAVSFRTIEQDSFPDQTIGQDDFYESSCSSCQAKQKREIGRVLFSHPTTTASQSIDHFGTQIQVLSDRLQSSPEQNENVFKSIPEAHQDLQHNSQNFLHPIESDQKDFGMYESQIVPAIDTCRAPSNVLHSNETFPSNWEALKSLFDFQADSPSNNIILSPSV